MQRSQRDDSGLQLKLPTIGKRSFAITSSVEEHVHTSTDRQSVTVTINSTTTLGSKVRVLIVEDSTSIAKMMSRWLEKNDCVVSCAPNGKIGLAMLKETQYDIMFLDFLMVCSKTFVSMSLGDFLIV